MTDSQRLAALEEAIALGVTEVTMNGRKITYRSLAEMRSIRDELKRSVNGSSGPDVLKPYFDKGYY